MKEIQRKQVAFKVTSTGEDGKFSGYASVFNNLDSYKEIVAPGAFAESLARLKASGDPLPVLWQHRSGEPIGGSAAGEMSEDEHGLKVDGFLLVNEIPRAKEAHALLKRRVVRGLSIGYYVEDSSYNEKERITTLKKLDLVEYSVVTFPANVLATVDAVKSLDSIREFEDFLRDAGGFSRQQAKTIASGGWRALSEARDVPDDAASKCADMIRNFKIPTF